jgi:hypothetical protein
MNIGSLNWDNFPTHNKYMTNSEICKQSFIIECLSLQ